MDNQKAADQGMLGHPDLLSSGQSDSAKSPQQQTKDNHGAKQNKWIFGLTLGFYAGLIWGVVKSVEHYLKFTTVYPGFFTDKTLKQYHWTHWQGYFAGIVCFIAISVVAALIYTWLASRAKSAWLGIAYGGVCWLLLYVWIGPQVGTLPAVTKLTRTTIITDFCLFLIWGLFIGYTVMMEFTSFVADEPDKVKSS
jgi:uncharacterized membrane protein YagU involved in acid resistance